MSICKFREGHIRRQHMQLSPLIRSYTNRIVVEGKLAKKEKATA